MRFLQALTILAILTAPAAAQDSAEVLFAAGQFAAAERGFLESVARDTADYPSALRLGQIALFGNRLADAERWFIRAIALRPGDPTPKGLLAEAYSRQDAFARAVPVLRAANRASRADKLASFGAAPPNQIVGAQDSTRLPFVITDPLPVVRVSVNGSDTLFLLIDTGGGELIIDTSVARAVGAQAFGTGQGVFAGGTAPVTDGRVDSVRLGDFTVRNVPVRIMSIRHIGAALGRRVDGVLGTVLLYHFLATLDYPGQQLVLRRRTPAIVERFARDATARGAVVEPFWLAGDHFMFAWGRVNGRPPALLFVDTGLAGGGFVTSDSAARAFGVNLNDTTNTEGVGGAGRTRVSWFTVDSLSLGSLTARQVRGALGTIRFRESFGFDAGGIISHAFFRPYALTFDFDGMRLFLETP